MANQDQALEQVQELELHSLQVDHQDIQDNTELQVVQEVLEVPQELAQL